VVRFTPIEPLATSLEDAVVRARRRRISDLDAIAAASQDPDTLRWLDDTPTDLKARAAGMTRVEEAWRSGHAAPLVIVDPATDDPVGLINLQFRNDDVATLAYSVFPARRGHGIAPHAVRLVAGWAFRDLGLTELLLETDEANAASIRVAEKCQFQRIGSRTALNSEGDEYTRLVFATWWRLGCAGDDAGPRGGASGDVVE